MQDAKLFMNGKSQAVRLPKEYRFEGDKVSIRREGEKVILEPKKASRISWEEFFKLAAQANSDFLEERFNPLPQERDWF